MTYERTATYPCDPGSPGRARVWALSSIREALGPGAMTMLLDDAALVVSELMTNSLQAGCSRVTLKLTLDPGHLRVAVLDDVAGRPRVLDPEPNDPRGRGLHIVSTLASDWGVTRSDGGKEVWADLALIHTRAM